MPPRLYETSFTVPAGTPSNAPVSQVWRTEDNVIEDIEIEIPPGHNGLTGIRIMKGDVQLLPWSAGTFITANDYARVFPIGAYLPTGDVTLQGYNTGGYPHTFYLRMTVTNYNGATDQPGTTNTQALPAGSVTSAPDPLSPDALLGADTAAAVTAGDLSPSDIAPIDASDLTIPPSPEPTGLT
jgi:hypothetical protein